MAFMERLSGGNALLRFGKTEMVTRLWLQAVKQMVENKP